jgi:hypothetical protein
MSNIAFHLIQDEINPRVREFVYGLPKVNAREVGLDERCGLVYVAEDAIICYTGNDRQLQYYGGFEYVDRDYRMAAGDFVFYFRDDGRVEGCLEHWEQTQAEPA